MKIACFNACGLVGKAEEIVDFTQQNQINLMVILETHLKENESSVLKRPICDLRKHVHYGERRRGGIMILVDEVWRQETSIVYEDPGNNFAVIQVRDQIIAAAYLAPSLENCCIVEFINKAEEIAQGRDLILVGDLNARVGGIALDTSICTRGRILIQELAEKDLLIANPVQGRWTCVNYMGQSVVDHVITNGIEVNNYVVPDDCLGGSDHRPLVFEIPTGHEPQKNFTRWDVRKLANQEIAAEYQALLGEKKIEVLQRMIECQSPDECWDIFKDWISDALSRSCGSMHFYTQPNAKFWNDELREKKKDVITNMENLNDLINSNHQAPTIAIARRALHNNQIQYRKMLLERRNKVFGDIVDNLSNVQNAAVLMRYVKNVKARKNRKGCALDPSKINIHASHFLSTFGGCPMATELTEAIPLEQYTTKTIHQTEIEKEIKVIALGKAAGVDGIMAECYVHGGPHISQSMKILFQKIADYCKIPNEWRMSNVALIYKSKGSNQEAANYRPISLTVTARRIYERIIKRDLAEAEKLLSNNQGGFRSKRSTIQQVYAWAEINHNAKFLNVLLDLKAAYDMVDRRVLWNLLRRKFNIDYSTVKRLQDLFEKNNCSIIINGSKSDPIQCRRGLLQGSSLSPLLFNLFINGLLYELDRSAHKIKKAGVKTNHLAFADDVVLIAEDEPKMAEILRICEDWSIKVGMRFSPAKCVAISNRNDLNLKIYNEKLNCSANEKYLGINVKPNEIDFDRLAKDRTDKAKGIIAILGNLGRNINGFSVEASSRLYKSVIRPLWSMVWNSGQEPKKRSAHTKERRTWH